MSDRLPLPQDTHRTSAPVDWPGGARCAAMISFDFDAETMWLSRDTANIQRPALISHGTYAAKVAIPEILAILRDAGIRATFFVPGWTADNHPAVVASILEAGHEIGHHGYLHFWPEPDKPREEDRLVGLLAKYGMIYDSSFMDDIHPYVHRLDGRDSGVVELPWHWSLDDVPYTVYSLRGQRAIQTNEHIRTIWSDEFREYYQRGALFDLIMHPQAIGRPSRLRLLADFLRFVASFPGVWFATAGDIAKHVLEARNR